MSAVVGDAHQAVEARRGCVARPGGAVTGDGAHVAVTGDESYRVVAGVGDIDLAEAVNGYTARGVEARLRAGAIDEAGRAVARDCGRRSVDGDAADAVVVCIGD